MEFGSIIQQPKLVGSDLETKHAGFNDFNLCLRQFFSQNTIDIISYKVTELLMGVDPQNRKIIVPNQTILNIMDSVYTNFRPQTGDIFTRFTMPTGFNSDDYINNMIDQTIEIIYSEVKNNLEIEENNKKLSVWTTVLGNFNDNGLRSFPPIKILNKHPAHMQINMNY